MASQTKSRWNDGKEDATLDAQRKWEKELKKKAKAEKQQKLNGDDETLDRQKIEKANTITNGAVNDENVSVREPERPAKRRRLSPEKADTATKGRTPTKLLRFSAPEWGPCRHVDNFEKLNHIEEGSYGWVSRAREIATGEVVALKKLKMDSANDGFPVTGLREIQTLMASDHSNIVALREIVMGEKLDE